MSLDYTSRLWAVNVMLGTIGESPVNTLEGAAQADVISALAVLDEVGLELLTEGWTFNHESEYPLLASAAPPHEIIVPSALLEAYPTDSSLEYVVRGGRLYDRANHTYSFPAGTKVLCEVAVRLPFEDWPESARSYATIRAARIFQNRSIGDAQGDGFTREDERAAKSIFRKNNARVRRANLLRDNWSVLRVISR